MNEQLFSLVTADDFDQNKIVDWSSGRSREELVDGLKHLGGMMNDLFIKNIKRTQGMFGPSFEGMAQLFDPFTEGLSDAEKAEILEMAKKENDQEETVIKEHTRKKNRKAKDDLIRSLPVEETVVEPDDPLFLLHKDQCCPVSADIREEYGYRAAKLFNRRTYLKNYVYEDQDGNIHYFCARNNKDQKEIKTKLLPGSYVSPELGAYVISSKFMVDNPLYRQALVFERAGIEISRQTMDNWSLEIAERYLVTVAETIREDILKQHYLHLDQTPVRVLGLKTSKAGNETSEPAKKKNKYGTVNVCVTDRFSPLQAACYQFTIRKDSESLAKLIPADFDGAIVCDAYQGHNMYEQATIQNCMAHSRRKFTDALRTRVDYKQYLKLDPAKREEFLKQEKNATLKQSLEILSYYNRLYKQESLSKSADENPEQLLERRQKISLPIFNELSARVHDLAKGFRPGSPLAKASNYFVEHEAELSNFLLDGRVDIDNNRCERMVKAMVMAKKNFLFFGSERGGEAGAACMTVLQTAVLNGLNPESYLAYLLDNLRGQPLKPEIIRPLLPYSDQVPDSVRAGYRPDLEKAKSAGTAASEPAQAKDRECADSESELSASSQSPALPVPASSGAV